MDFYSNLSYYYDEVFPLDNNKVLFLKEAFQDKNNILDIGCATGAYVKALSDEGFNVLGIDLDQDMIKLAKKKYPDLQFKVLDMMDLKDEKYDGIYCIGNTLVHIQDINKAITNFEKSLNHKGVLVIQILNYDRILNEKITTLPLIKNDKLTFIRNYEFNKDYLNFHTTLVVKDNSYASTTKLYPFRYHDLCNILKNNGFMDINAYNGFTKTPFNIRESFALVITARKE